MTGAPLKPSDCQKPLPGAPVIGFSDLLGRPTRILSLGGGVQSTTMLLMSIHRDLPRPDFAIFADTQDETDATYKHVGWLASKSAAVGITLLQVTAGKLEDAVLRKSKRTVDIPSFGDKGGMGKRQCTREFKTDLIARKLREMGIKKATMWIGISLDEAHRMKETGKLWLKNEWPLVEKRMTRWDCIRWLESHGYSTPPKSACRFCPYHSDAYWRDLKTIPNEFEKAVAVDRELNKRGQYLHRSLVPLDKVDLRNDEDMGQEVMFGNECEGMCGV